MSTHPRHGGRRSDTKELAGWYDELMLVSHDAFAHGHYETAYHALAAALHCADKLADTNRLMEVAGTAQEQGMWVDDHEPLHPLSSRSSKAREG